MIDLHLHTTASDGFDTPEHLVAQLAGAGIRVFAVTDHDTVAALPAVAALAREQGLGWLPGIEVTAVEGGRDVHVLGYGFDPTDATFNAFLAEQRAARLDRIAGFRDRFATLGMPFDAEPLLQAAAADGGRAVGRAHVARALLAAGHVASIAEAFDRWLSPGHPGFVARRAASVAEVVRRIRAAGGIASLAHPHLLHDDALVRDLIRCGLDALEVFHSEHDAVATERYRRLCDEAGLAQTGGSDFHGDASNRRRTIGGVSLPVAAYAMLRERGAHNGRAQAWPAIEDLGSR